MKHMIHLKTPAALCGVLLLGSTAISQTVVYSENFDTEPGNVTDFSVSLGGDAGADNKEVVIGQWGITGNGSFAGGALSPQDDGNDNARLGGLFLDSSTLNQGAGTYVLEFDVIGADAGAAYVYVSTGSGFDASNFLVLDLANAGFAGGSWEPLSATGSASASQLSSLAIDTTLSQTGVQIFFPYDGTSAIAISFGAYNSDVAFDNLSISTSPAYETDFEGYVLNTDFIKDFNISYGGTAPASTKAAASLQWGMTANGNDFAGGIMRPQDNPATNLKLAGLFFDPSVFTAGPGAYEISFELTGDAAGNAAYRAFVFAGSGYDLSGTNDDRLQLSLSAPGFPGYSGLTAAGNATASQLVEVDLSTKASTAGTSTVTVRFCWDGTSAIAFSIGGYNNAATIDNLVLSKTVPYETDFEGFVAGTDFVKDFNIAYGGIKPANTKLVDSGQWGITTNGNDFTGGIARPQDNPATNLKLAGLFLDPSTFCSGAGTYRIRFDLTGDSAGNPAYRAYVFAGSGYDLTGAVDDRLQLNLSAGGFGGYTGLTAAGNATASELLMVDLGTEASTAATTPVTMTFDWDGTSAIAFSIGGYNNAATFDNFSVTPAISVSGPVTVTGTLVNGSGELVIDFLGDPSTDYEVTRSTDLSGFGSLTSPLIVTTNGSGVGQAIVPATEVSGTRQFFRLEDNN